MDKENKTGVPGIEQQSAWVAAGRYALPFCLITICFAMWGFANDVTNPMVKAFSKIFRMGATGGSLVQVAFYGGYFAMAIPAALFIRRFSYKTGVLAGLFLYAAGAFLFLPAREAGEYYPFLIAYFVMTCGLSFLETSCNPYILAMGPRESAIRRLNLAQAFNPVGSLLGMWVAMEWVQKRLDPLDSEGRMTLNDADFEAVKGHDLSVLTQPYVGIGIAVAVLFVLILLARMPKGQDGGNDAEKGSLHRLLSDKTYMLGVLAQFFYVGAQIMVWTFIIQYGTHAFMGTGMTEQAAEIESQKLNIIAMVLFCCSRFVSTWLMKRCRPAAMLLAFATAAVLLTLGAILLGGTIGIWCLVGVSGAMSLMFPTIYGLALNRLSASETKFGAAGLIMAILGGSVLPPLQASVIDLGIVCGMPAVNVSFLLPLICFLIVGAYGRFCIKRTNSI